MCGIVGIVNKRTNKSLDLRSIINEMSDALIHRGPDNKGEWISNEKDVAFGHRRLSIQDLSQNGNQPMISSSGRYVIVFNGEIYNFKSLKTLFKNHKWIGNSDTEVILELIEKYGFKDALCMLKGMFAIAVYDHKKSKIFLSIDRFGEKPLYYSLCNNLFIFASELKSISKIASNCKIDLEICNDSFTSYTYLSYVPAPRTIYKHIFKLEPGHIVEVSINSEDKICLCNKKYWSTSELISNMNISGRHDSYQDSVNKLDNKLDEIIKNQLISDAPIGCFLSGGIDSSLVASIASKSSQKRLKTFTMGFQDSSYDESEHARRIASFLDTEHQNFVVSPQDALDVIPDLPSIYDEPFGDSSQIPTVLLSRLTSNSVKVALSGDAGDEIFGGYNRYVYANKIWNLIKNKPNFIKMFFKKVISVYIKSPYLKKLAVTNLQNKIPQFDEKINKIFRVIDSASEIEIYNNLISNDISDDLLKNNQKICLSKKESVPLNIKESFIEMMMFLDTVGYLPGDILTKVDRAAMSSSLETRIPFLDHELVEFAWTLPQKYKINSRGGKIILKDTLAMHLPQNLYERPKKGFNLPVCEWLREPLREWMLDTLNYKKIIEQNFYNAQDINILISDHLELKKDNHSQLWNILMFQSWYDNSR